MANSIDTPQQRLVSLDAYRGAIMLLMASAGFDLTQLSHAHPGSALWQTIGYNCDHAEWRGCSLWDLIQPAFMYMVGVALAWSVANRRAKGQSDAVLFAHALWRSVILVLLAVFITSNSSKSTAHTTWVFTNVLAQIGLGYPFLFLISYTQPKIQWIAAFGILVVYWLAFALYPLPPKGYDWWSVDLGPDWTHLTGFAAHWEKNINFASAFDQWFLNLFPRTSHFRFNESGGGYQTLNFVPSLATMIFGLIAGRLMRSDRSIPQKVLWLALFGAAGLAIGGLIDLAGICPIVKRIWTPSFAIFSAGWVTLILAAFVVIIEWKGWKRWAFPLIVVGLNPITMYCLFQLSARYIVQSIKIHAGQNIFERFGAEYTRSFERAAALVVMWLIVYWMYRRKITVRI